MCTTYEMHPCECFENHTALANSSKLFVRAFRLDDAQKDSSGLELLVLSLTKLCPQRDSLDPKLSLSKTLDSFTSYRPQRKGHVPEPLFGQFNDGIASVQSCCCLVSSMSYRPQREDLGAQLLLFSEFDCLRPLPQFHA